MKQLPVTNGIAILHNPIPEESLIPGANANTYTPLTTTVGTQYYYCVVTNSLGCTLASNVSGVVGVFPPISNNIINSSKTICYGTTAGTLTGTVPAGGNLTYAFNWESSPDGVSLYDLQVVLHKIIRQVY